MPKPPDLKMYAAALTREEMDENIIMEWGPFVPSDIDRWDWITAMIKDHKIAKHTTNALLIYPSLVSHCPRCTQIHDHRHRSFSSEKCAVLNDGPLEGFLPCKYIYCAMQPMHARKYCQRINLRCFNCMHRGHAEVDNVCRNVDVNLALFKDSADVGLVTPNRFRHEGSASGFFPVITLPQVRHIENTGGYLRLLPMSIREAQELVDEGIILLRKWVGAEPYFTQAVARQGTSWQRTTQSMPRTWGA
jgi:hypothetical protein